MSPSGLSLISMFIFYSSFVVSSFWKYITHFPALTLTRWPRWVPIACLGLFYCLSFSSNSLTPSPSQLTLPDQNELQVFIWAPFPSYPTLTDSFLISSNSPWPRKVLVAHLAAFFSTQFILCTCQMNHKCSFGHVSYIIQPVRATAAVI